MEKVSKGKKARSIKFKLMLFTILLILVLTAANLITGLLTSYQGILKNVREDLTSIGEVANLALSAKIQVLQDDLQKTAETDLTADSSADLTALAKKNGWLYLAVADSAGKVQKGPSALLGRDVASRPLFEKALSGETVISSPFTDRTGAFAINVYTPFRGGALIAGVDGMYLSDLIKNFRVGQTGNIFIIDGTGTMIANMRPQLVQERQNFINMAKTDSGYVSAAALYAKMITGASGVDTYDYVGVNRICYYAPVGKTGWYFGAVAPVNEMTSSIRGIAAAMLIVSLVLAVLGIFTVVRFAGRMTNPMIRLTHRMKLLSEGNLTAEVPKIGSNDEIGELARSIDSSVRTLSLYVKDIARIMEQIAAGDLRVRPSQAYIGDFRPIETAFYNSVRNLSATLSRVRGATEQVGAGAEQVSSGAQSLAAGSSEQAATVEELSASVTTVAEQAGKNSTNVKTAAEFVGQAGASVHDGNEHMEKLTQAMENIGSASNQIASVTKAIEDIAFQTNILALNAAVEAARAGDAGKGFAVVADEVRSLATKSAEAAKQTADLIQHSVSAVAEGSQITERTARILQDIREKADRVTESIANIERASSEQVTAIDQIRQGLSQVSAVVQTNAATAEENSATSEEMSAQVAALREEVAKFKLDSGEETNRAAGASRSEPAGAAAEPASGEYGRPCAV